MKLFLKKIQVVLGFAIFLLGNCYNQILAQENQWLVSFPITDYIIEEDSMLVVQVHIKDPNLRIKEKTLAILEPKDQVFNGGTRGYYKCTLVKGDYFYFVCYKYHPNNRYKSDPEPGDLLYMVLERTADFPKKGNFSNLISHNITLLDIHGEKIYDRTKLIYQLNSTNQNQILKKCIEDIKFTATEHEKQNDKKDLLIEKGPYKGKKLVTVMKECTEKDLDNFFSYIDYNHTLYAGKSWKISVIFAAWVISGAPMPEKKT